MKTVKEIWIDLFDSSLENYKHEDETIRKLSMLFHILKKEYEKTSQYIVELKRQNVSQIKQLSEYKQKGSSLAQNCNCKINNRTPLKTLSGNCNETTPIKKKYANQNISTSFDISDNEDIFNHQISELDANLSKENDCSLFVDDSVEDFEITTSPTLNKHKKQRLSRAAKVKKEHIKNSPVNDIIMNTPTPKINRSRKLKQTTLSISRLNNTTKQKNCTITKNETTNAHNSIDSDETLFLPAQQINIPQNNFMGDSEVLEILKDLKQNASSASKRIKLNNSYDCLPDRENDSPEFAYKREAVRKKSERMKLQGWDCQDCEKYYGAYKHGLSDEEIRKKMDQCSRHRNKFNPNILTPKGFWNPDFSPTQDSIAFNIQ